MRVLGCFYFNILNVLNNKFFFNKCKYFEMYFDIIKKIDKKMKPVDTLVRISKTAA